MDNLDRLRVAYHEAGHAVLAHQLGSDFNDFNVTVYSAQRDGRLGTTEYLRDKTKNLNQDDEFGKKLLIFSWGGCIGEEIFCENHSLTKECKYGSDDSASRSKTLSQMLKSPKENESLLQKTEEYARRIIYSKKENLKKIAEMLNANPDKAHDFSEISAIMNPL